MTKFEKMTTKAKLLEAAYQAVLECDKWDNMIDGWSGNAQLNPEREEMHAYYMEIAGLIEKLLDN